MPEQRIIEIVESDAGGVAFHPFAAGARPGDPLRAESGDTVVWSNRTDRDLELKSTDPPGLSLDQTVAAGESSTRLFVFQGPRIQYMCVSPQQLHEIELLSLLTVAPARRRADKPAARGADKADKPAARGADKKSSRQSTRKPKPRATPKPRKPRSPRRGK